MLYMYLLTAAACRARGLAAARSLSRRSVRLRAGSTKTLDALREELDKNNVDAAADKKRLDAEALFST